MEKNMEFSELKERYVKGNETPDFDALFGSFMTANPSYKKELLQFLAAYIPSHPSSIVSFLHQS